LAVYKQENTKDSIKRYQKIVYSIILWIAVVWCAGILIAPLWADCTDFRGSTSEFFYNLYGTSCHQEDARSIYIGQHKLGVCSRCTSIYFAFLLATIIYPFVRKLNNLDMPPLWLLIAGAGLVALDAGLDILDITKNTFVTREITGAILGFILPFFIIPGTIRLFHEFFLPPKVIPKKSSEKN
jgi:uncharacterized membrane protein